MATTNDESAAALHGRDHDLRQLGCALESVRAGHPALVVVDGPAGIGKTALVERFEQGARGVQVVWAAGAPMARGVRFSAVDELVPLARPRLWKTSLDGLTPEQYPSVGLPILEAFGERQEAGPVAVVVDD